MESPEKVFTLSEVEALLGKRPSSFSSRRLTRKLVDDGVSLYRLRLSLLHEFEHHELMKQIRNLIEVMGSFSSDRHWYLISCVFCADGVHLVFDADEGKVLCRFP